MPHPSIVCFGEILWDLLPTGKIAGGAPMNVAYHANRFSLATRMISRVGADDLGRELLAFLNEKGIPADLVQTDPTFPTGIVKVTLDEKGSPSYEIVSPVAWDYIHPGEQAKEAVKNAGALVFGSLACRTDRSKNTLLELLELAPLKVFDVNLRPPFFSKSLLDELLPKADLVKMNDEELDIVAGWHGVEASESVQMEFVKKQYDPEALIVTKGARGAALLDAGGHHTHAGFRVTVQDTIGSGDAFLGAFLSKYLGGTAPAECLEFACKAGAFVATKKGATPDYSLTDLFRNF
jgi:fructokinase